MAYSNQTAEDIRRIVRSYELGSTINGVLLRDYDLLRERLKEHGLRWRKPVLVEYQEREGLVTKRVLVDGHSRPLPRTPARHRSITRVQHVQPDSTESYEAATTAQHGTPSRENSPDSPSTPGPSPDSPSTPGPSPDSPSTPGPSPDSPSTPGPSPDSPSTPSPKTLRLRPDSPSTPSPSPDSPSTPGP